MNTFEKKNTPSARIRFLSVYLVSVVLMIVLIISLGKNTSYSLAEKELARNESDKEEFQLINTNRLLHERLTQIDRQGPLPAAQYMKQSIDSIEAMSHQYKSEEGKSALHQVVRYYKDVLDARLRPEVVVTKEDADPLVQNERREYHQKMDALQTQLKISLLEKDKIIATLKKQLQVKTVEMVPPYTLVSAPAKGGTIQDIRQSNINLSLGFKSLQNKIWSMTRDYNELRQDNERLKGRLSQLQKNGGSE